MLYGLRRRKGDRGINLIVSQSFHKREYWASPPHRGRQKTLFLGEMHPQLRRARRSCCRTVY